MISLLEAAKDAGVYSIPEAARYAKMHQNSLRNWFAGGRDRAPLERPHALGQGEHARPVGLKGFAASGEGGFDVCHGEGDATL